MLLFDRRDFRAWRWWEVLFDAMIIYGVSSLAAGLIAGPSSLIVAQLLFVQPYEYDLAWTRYILAWVIQPCVFVGLLLTIGIGRGYSAQLFWSALPAWSWKPWSAVVAAALSWCAAEILFLDAWFKDELLRDAEILAYLLSTPFAGITAILAIVIAPVTEEVVFRQILLVPLASSKLGFLGATILTSLLWAIIHFYSWPGTMFIFASGLALCYLAKWARSIWPGVAAHAALNAGAVVAMLLYLQNPS